jgi:uncharacterized damage-inducible protein DinB
MTPATAADLFAYTAWANAAVLDAAAALGADAWTRRLGGSFPSLQAVLAHTAGGERVWLDRWTRRAPTTFPAFTVDPAPGDLRDAFRAIEAERDAWLCALTDAALATPYAYTLFSGESSAEPLADQITHLANHSTYHRGQAAAMIRAMDAAPPPTDFIRWARLGRPAPDAA